MDYTLSHLSRAPQQESDGAPPGLLLLHGFGSNMQDLMGLAPYLDPRLHVVSAQAPFEMGPGMFAWYMIQMLPGGEFLIDQGQAAESLDLISTFIGEIVEGYGLDPERLYIGGFSQGAINSCATLLREPERVAGALLMSGRWPEGVSPVEPERLAGKPVIQTHGRFDPTIQIRFGRELRERLDALSVALDYHEYPMGHEINAEALGRVARWLETQLEEH